MAAMVMVVCVWATPTLKIYAEIVFVSFVLLNKCDSFVKRTFFFLVSKYNPRYDQLKVLIRPSKIRVFLSRV